MWEGKKKQKNNKHKITLRDCSHVQNDLILYLSALAPVLMAFDLSLELWKLY